MAGKRPQEQVRGDLVTATAASSLVACFIMGAFANMPLALAPGMGLNAYFAYNVVGYRGTGTVRFHPPGTEGYYRGTVWRHCVSGSRGSLPCQRLSYLLQHGRDAQPCLDMMPMISRRIVSREARAPAHSGRPSSMKTRLLIPLCGVQMQYHTNKCCVAAAVFHSAGGGVHRGLDLCAPLRHRRAGGHHPLGAQVRAEHARHDHAAGQHTCAARAYQRVCSMKPMGQVCPCPALVRAYESGH